MADASNERLLTLEYDLLKARYGTLLTAADDAEVMRRLEGFASAVEAIRAYPLVNGDTPLAAPEQPRGDA